MRLLKIFKFLQERFYKITYPVNDHTQKLFKDWIYPRGDNYVDGIRQKQTETGQLCIQKINAASPSLVLPNFNFDFVYQRED